MGRGRFVKATLVAVLFAALTLGGGTAVAADSSEQTKEKQPITLDILDEDALLLIERADGRDVVQVVGRSRIRHKDRTVLADELQYDEERSYAIMDGSVQLDETGEDGLHLTADHMELDLNTEGAFAEGNVHFERSDARGRADTLHYGRYSAMQQNIEQALSGRPERVAARVLTALASFLPDDDVLVLQGNIDLVDGDREFRSDFVVMNTRDDALVSIGRSTATLPGPDEE